MVASLCFLRYQLCFLRYQLCFRRYQSVSRVANASTSSPGSRAKPQEMQTASRGLLGPRGDQSEVEMEDEGQSAGSRLPSGKRHPSAAMLPTLCCLKVRTIHIMTAENQPSHELFTGAPSCRSFGCGTAQPENTDTLPAAGQMVACCQHSLGIALGYLTAIMFLWRLGTPQF